MPGVRDRVGDRVDFARGHVARIYGDVLGWLSVVRLSGDPAADIAAVGLAGGSVEHATPQGFAFWNPDGSRYATKSTPPQPPSPCDGRRCHLPQHAACRARRTAMFRRG
jgi:hypothetical protein